MTQKLFDIEPLAEREALPEQVVRRLAGLVKRGALKPGDRLPAERALADQLGIGRPTLREALRALKLLGIVDIRHGGGVFVSELQPDELLGPLRSFWSIERHHLATVLEARRVIEGAVLAFVARTIDDHSLRKLQANLDEFQKLAERTRDEADVVSKCDELAKQFRAVIQDAADNPILTRAVTSLDILTTTTRRGLTSRTSLQRLLDNHRHIVAALAAHDPEAAQRALEAHIDYLCELYDIERRDDRHARNDAARGPHRRHRVTRSRH